MLSALLFISFSLTWLEQIFFFIEYIPKNELTPIVEPMTINVTGTRQRAVPRHEGEEGVQKL